MADFLKNTCALLAEPPGLDHITLGRRGPRESVQGLADRSLVGSFCLDGEHLLKCRSGLVEELQYFLIFPVR